ncbi:MAG: hypothetical protein O2901_00790 [Verrucomicrobia bacterium]|nr:hypothetical protein [Verrucomicrobiota bacterium]
MIEFIVAIVCVVVIFVGILQIGLLGMARTEVMVEARHEAGAMAMLDIVASPLPDYIKDWDEGPDTRPYSADDRSNPGDVYAVATRIAAYADPSQINAVLPDNIITRVESNPEFEIGVGLLKGDARETVPLFPAITHLVYDEDEIRVEGEVWIPWTRGIY